MKFIDKVKIKLKAGNGGDGAVAFRRELYVPKGGPAGGDGGKGGDIIFIGNNQLSTLLDLKFQQEIRAADGEHGMHKNMHGKNGKDTIVNVPLGTVIFDYNQKQIGEIITNGQQLIVASGGKGGRGNTRFTSSRNRAPSIFERGNLGQEHEITCELKLLADVGIIGKPNAGKSTLLSIISKAKPEIGDYEFTTLIPQLGVSQTKDKRSFVVADLPGLIAGASLGKGLGHQFLRHIERCKILVHLVDITNEDYYQNYLTIRKELNDYNQKLSNKFEIIVASKVESDGDINEVNKFKKLLDNKEILSISAITNEGIDQLLYKIADKLEEIKDEDEVINNEFVSYKFEAEKEEIIVKNLGNGQWDVSGATIYNIYYKFPLTTHDNLLLFNKKINDLGVNKILTTKGVKKGDIVNIFDLQLEWKE